MNAIASIVADVAAAVLRGAILHAGPAADEAVGEFGIIDCDRALEAFDPRSDAWHGRDGVPHRFTEEEAEARARRLNGSGATVCAALRLPSRPIRASVGSFAVAGQGPCFRCLDWTSGPGDVVPVSQAVPRIDPTLGLDHDYEDDPSAFGAALAFVRLVGEREAYAALAREADR